MERRKVSELVPYARNARTHSDAQVRQIAASIEEWGWTNPILIDEDSGIIAGHGRLMAADKLGLKDVPVMVAKGWSEAQKKAYILADNQLALNAGWDEQLAGLELQELHGLDFDVSLIGFDAQELEDLMYGADFEPGSLDDQGRLDKVGKDAQCPSCGHVFDPVENVAEN
jgi:ParB-like chromosome segregation protein Spo0J